MKKRAPTGNKHPPPTPSKTPSPHYNAHMSTDIVGKELTQRQAEILDFKAARWSLRKIARHLNLNYSTVREHYLDALAKCGAETHDLTKLPTSLDRHEWRRIEESEFIDARIRDYLDIKERALNEGQLRNAVEALNGAHKYMETLIKLQGISAPERREITITNELLANKLAALEAEVGKVTDAEVVTYEINS